MVLASASMGADMPRLTPEHETSVETCSLLGTGWSGADQERGEPGTRLRDLIASRLAERNSGVEGIYRCFGDWSRACRISASLRAIEQNLKYITIERDEIGGTVASIHGRAGNDQSGAVSDVWKVQEDRASKENLLAFWDSILNRADFNC